MNLPEGSIEFYTPQEVADVLRVKVTTVYEYVRKGKLRAARIGKSYRVALGDLEAFIASRTPSSVAAAPEEMLHRSAGEAGALSSQVAEECGSYVLEPAPTLTGFREIDNGAHGHCQITLLPPQDSMETLSAIREPVMAAILDPWYNRGVGGVVEGYDTWLIGLVNAAADVSEHVFLWGFPDIIYKVMDHLPRGTEFIAWLTWYYKNCPSVIRGWRSAQLTCLHIARVGARLYPEHFLNDAQLQKQAQGKLRYMPGPPSVFEAPLNIGFVGRQEQTGHPAQKPISVIEPLILMSTVEGDTILDPMCGSGTTGVACQMTGRNAILCDRSPEYMAMTAARLKAGPAANGHLRLKYSLKNSNDSLFSSSEAL